jgi:hypothetical protein
MIYGQYTRTNDPLALRTTGQPGRFNGLGDSPIADREPTSHRPEIAGIASRRRGVQARQGQRGGFPVDNAAYSSYTRKEQHGGKDCFVSLRTLPADISRQVHLLSRLGTTAIRPVRVDFVAEEHTN